MYCFNHRIGILFRENLARKSYELRYFFVDDDANLYYIASLPRLQKVIRMSKSTMDIRDRLEKLGERSFNLIKYAISGPKPYVSQAVLPFCNRSCLEIKEKQAKSEEKAYLLFGLFDDDTAFVHQQILSLTGKNNKKSVPKANNQHEQRNEQKQLQNLFQEFTNNQQQTFKMKNNPNNNKPPPQKQQYQYGGEQLNGVPHGNGKQILLSAGISFNGQFQNGNKHGPGYLVNEHLVTLECQFLNDQLTGI